MNTEITLISAIHEGNYPGLRIDYCKFTLDEKPSFSTIRDWISDNHPRTDIMGERCFIWEGGTYRI